MGLGEANAALFEARRPLREAIKGEFLFGRGPKKKERRQLPKDAPRKRP